MRHLPSRLFPDEVFSRAGLIDSKDRMPRSVLDELCPGYDPSLGRFIQPDTIIPGAANSQVWNRYSYVLNDPIVNNDPSGNRPCWAGKKYRCILTTEQIQKLRHSSNPNEILFINNYLKTRNLDKYFVDIAQPSINEINSNIIDFGNNNNIEVNNFGFSVAPIQGDVIERIDVASSDSQPNTPILALLASAAAFWWAGAMAEIVLGAAEIVLAVATITQPELTPVTVGLELFLVGAGFAIGNAVLSYEIYTYRKIFYNSSETIEYEFWPPYGLDITN